MVKKRTQFALLCLVLFLAASLAANKKNAGTTQVAMKNMAEASQLTAEANQNNLTSAAEATRHKGVIVNQIASGDQKAAAQQAAEVVLAEAAMMNGGDAQSASDFQFMTTAYAQAVAARQGDHAVILPNQAVMLADAISQQFSGEEEAKALHLAAGIAPINAHFACCRTGLTNPNAGVVT